jgi:hypothetical protein
MAKKNVKLTASQTGLVTPAVPAEQHIQVPAVKAPTKVEVRVTRKPSVQTVQTGLSSRKDTGKTVPYVLLRKPTKPHGKVTRQIINFINVGETQDSSHVQPMRVAVVNCTVYGTNLGQGSINLRTARFFQYVQSFAHGKTARTVQAWDVNNEDAIRALRMFGAITQYELEWHLDQAKLSYEAFLKAAADKNKAARKKLELTQLKAKLKTLAKDYGDKAVRDVARAALVMPLL